MFDINAATSNAGSLCVMSRPQDSSPSPRSRPPFNETLQQIAIRAADVDERPRTGDRMLRDIRHSWPVAVGVAVGGMVLTQFAPLMTAAIQTFDEQLFMRGIGWFHDNGYRLPSVVLNHPWSITLALYAVVGSIVGRIAGPRRAAVVLAFAASVFAGGMNACK